jgi:hypothetical protein
MLHRTLLASAAIGALALGLAAAPTASAGNVAWSVSIGVPGLAVTAGAPGWYGPAYRPYPYYRPRYRPVFVASPPVVVAAPVVYAPYRPVVVAPYRPVVVAPPVIVRPRYYGPAPYRY